MIDSEKLNDEVAQATKFVKPLKDEIGKIIVGQDKLIERLLIGLVTGGHLLVEGVPGLAKTLTINSLATALSANFNRIQFTPDLLPADVVGTQIYNPKEHIFSIKQGPIFANLILADEINRAPAKVQSALLEAMQEKQVTLGGETQPLPKPFLVMATQNPIDQEGTYSLPEAQKDRFMMNVIVDYPSRNEELEIINRMAKTTGEEKIFPVASLDLVQDAKKIVDKVYLDDKIAEYILDIVFATRVKNHTQLSDRQDKKSLSWLDSLIDKGASPRASLSLVLAAKAKAFLDGRGYVLPTDVKELAPDILRHRIMVTYEAEAEELDSGEIIEKILAELRTP